jgi:hypothetical protein
VVGKNGQKRRGGLLDRITCPHCWEHFAPEKVLWISEHQDLLGDPKLGPEQQQRFLPTRFTVAGEALDARGFACQQLACPNCHLAVPRPFLEMEPLFLSIFGAAALKAIARSRITLGGRGMALSGLILGIIGLIFWVIFVLFWFGLLASFLAAAGIR